MDVSVSDDDGPSCGALEALQRQDLMVNRAGRTSYFRPAFQYGLSLAQRNPFSLALPTGTLRNSRSNLTRSFHIHS